MLHYDPGTLALKCPYCGHENPIAKSDKTIEELDYRAALAAGGRDAETHTTTTVKCPTCAAEFTFDPHIQSDSCPFCGSPIVLEPRQSTHLKPRSLLPFKVGSKEARERFRKWLSGLWFAPSALKKQAQSEGGLSGMYVPYWTYDSSTTSRYTGERGDEYQVQETYTAMEDGKPVTRTRTVTKIRWTPAKGTVARDFDDVLVLASSSLPRHHTERLEPWDLQNLVPYSQDYLSGFRTETYRIDLEQGFERAKEIMDAVIRADVRRDIGGDHQRIHSLDTRHDDITYKHLLLPVWLAAYRYRGKSYRFVVNGRTGEVSGERPYSWIKIALAVLAVILLLAAIYGIYVWTHGHPPPPEVIKTVPLPSSNQLPHLPAPYR